MKIKSKKMMFFVPVAAAIIVFALLVKFKSKPAGGKAEEQAVFVNVFRVSAIPVIPKVIGFGTVQPDKIWRAYPQVSGKIIWLSDRLDAGEFFRAGQKMLEIDDSVYKLKIIQQKAEIKKIEANLLELKAKEKNYQAMLELQKRTLAISLREQERQKQLAKKKVVSESSLEKQQITTLAQENNVQNIQITLDLIPSQLKALQAQLESAKALLEQAELDLEYTVISAPFDCRISKVNVEISQYVQPGQEMLEADSIEASEVIAQVDTGRLSTLILNRKTPPHKLNLAASKYIAIPERLGLRSVIKYRPNGKTFEWEARCERLEPIDPNTRTVGIAAVVDNPYGQVNAVRPPLIKGMYCEVDIYGREQPDRIVIPRSSVHNGMVYRVTSDSRLEIRKIEILYEMSQITVVKSGLKAGDKVVCSDLVPAIEGMLLDTVPNEALEKRIKAVAVGEQGGL